MKNKNGGDKKMDEIEEIEIDNIDNMILKFKGTLIGSYDTMIVAGMEQNRWDSTDIYKTINSAYVVVNEHHTCWQGEVNENEYEVFENKEELMEYAKNEGDYILKGAMKDAGMPVVVYIE